MTPKVAAVPVGAAFSRVVAETVTATILSCKAVSLYRRSKQVRTAFS
jgi:hypothetical protein